MSKEKGAYFVVAAELDTDKTDYKVFDKHADAERRFMILKVAALDDAPVGKGKSVHVMAARLYRVDAADVRATKDAVVEGKGTLLQDSADPWFDLEDFELIGLP